MTALDETPVYVGSGEASSVLREAGELTTPGIGRALGRLVEPAHTVVGFHLGWWDRTRAPIPVEPRQDVCAALLLAAGRAAGGARADAEAPAVALELVHNSTMLQGDVLDGRLTRSGRPAAWTVFGRSQTLLAGNALLILGLERWSAESVHPSGELSNALLEMIAAHGADLAFDEGAADDVRERLELMTGKVAALFGGACALGAIAAGAEPETVARYRRFGHHLGLAAELVDDLRAMREVSAGPGGAEPKPRRRSLPVVAALNSCTGAGRRLTEYYDRPEPLDPAEAGEIGRLIEEAGGSQWVERAAARQRMRVLDSLALAAPDCGGADDLRALADLVTDRGYEQLA